MEPKQEMEMEVAESASECAVEKNARDAGFCPAKPVSLEQQGAPAVAEEEEVEKSVVVERNVRDAVFSPAKPESLEEEGAPTAAAAEEEVVEESVVDLTSWQLHDLEDVELPQQATELDLTANRLSTLDPRIGQMRRLKKLSLRQNLFTDEALQSLSHWPAIAGLQELVLRDNKLTKIPDVSTFKDLVIFDVSFNEISSLKGMSRVSPLLKEFYVSKNELTKIEELDHLHQLQILELGSNGLRVMEGLQNMAVLQELWLGRNRIRTVELCGLKSLVKISLQSNRLTSMLGFQDCIGLEELYLSHNGISKMEGLSSLVNLRVLDVSSNKLAAITGIENLTRLEDLWLNDNQIALLDGIDAALAGSKEKLTTIYLEHNPCAKDPSYISILRATFPNIQQIDSNCY